MSKSFASFVLILSFSNYHVLGSHILDNRVLDSEFVKLKYAL